MAAKKVCSARLLFAKLLISILPPHFGVGTGIIVDRYERQSKRTDIVVYDRRGIPDLSYSMSPAFFQSTPLFE